ncbi:hypothetical protein F8271_04730 [Micromonospora sp. ALFpr18c]|nr:hypothetical protein F8271_04730 [Micromonospora sp. ALFpr18c]
MVPPRASCRWWPTGRPGTPPGAPDPPAPGAPGRRLVGGYVLPAGVGGGSTRADHHDERTPSLVGRGPAGRRTGGVGHTGKRPGPG